MRDRSQTSRLVVMALMLVSFAMIVGCTRERPSSKTPIHLNPNMDVQPKYKAQAKSGFFDDGATMRQPVEGTVAIGELREDDALYSGWDRKGNFIKQGPLAITQALMTRGQERFDVYCAPCHSRLGDGRGIMITKNYVTPTNLHADSIRTFPDGRLFDVISNGVRNMPSYRHQISVEDRWAIIAYVRALQRSQNATLDDIPIEARGDIK
ncbi:MAG: cytochrome c [bacterium]